MNQRARFATGLSRGLALIQGRKNDQPNSCRSIAPLLGIWKIRSAHEAASTSETTDPIPFAQAAFRGREASPPRSR